MKKNQTVQSALLKKANKTLIWGTVLKVLLPGTGIGTLVSTTAWAMAMDDVYHHPENYPVFDTDVYRMLAGKLPKDVEEQMTESNENLEKEIKKFVDETKAKIDQIHKDDKGESQ